MFDSIKSLLGDSYFVNKWRFDKASLHCFLILESADRIDPLTVKAVNANTTSPGSIKIFWKEPEVSNGPIVSYQLEYKKVGDHVILI